MELPRLKGVLVSSVASVLTFGVVLGLARAWFPSLFVSRPKDLQVTFASKEVPPFFENVFREHPSTDDYIINDPKLMIRAPGLYPDRLGLGPNDVLGFRNRAVPDVADVITIGDSQTYGLNAVLEENWPSQMRRSLPLPTTVYNMSTGGWGGYSISRSQNTRFDFSRA